MEHQADVLQVIQTAKKRLAEGKFDEIGSLLDAAETKVQKRIKLIRIADSHEGGWKTVENYLSDEVASDSEDEKRIKSANKEALRKRKKAEEAKHRKGGNKGQYQPNQYVPRRYTPYQASQPFRAQGAKSGPCFSCGSFSHLVRFCPNKASGAGTSQAPRGSYGPPGKH